ncbi:hypothetical protein L1049_025392 [Liquidambar formosana]|uniref:Uncharacterized protein n=1 Tax=Liquidambar formosana TaxID=63359 RepID=A0AAP0R6B6_LIQFO
MKGDKDIFKLYGTICVLNNMAGSDSRSFFFSKQRNDFVEVLPSNPFAVYILKLLNIFSCIVDFAGTGLFSIKWQNQPLVKPTPTAENPDLYPKTSNGGRTLLWFLFPTLSTARLINYDFYIQISGIKLKQRGRHGLGIV